MPIENQVLEELVEWLSSPDAGLVKSACQQLAILTEDKEDAEIREKVAASGIIPHLVQLLNQDDTQQPAAQTLFHLARTKENRTRIREAGGVHRLLELLEPRPYTAASKNAALALINLASLESNRAVIREGSGVAVVTSLLQVPAEDPDQHALMIEYGCRLLSTLLSSSNTKVAVAVKKAAREAGAVELLVHQLHPANRVPAAYAALCLSRLAAGSAQNRDAIRDGGGLERLVALLQACPPPGKEKHRETSKEFSALMRHTAAAIVNASSNSSSNKEVLRGCQAVEAVAAALAGVAKASPKNKNVQEGSPMRTVVYDLCLCIRNLVTSRAPAQLKLVELGVVPVLLQYLRQGGPQKAAAAALASLGAHVKVQEALRDAGALPQLFGMMQAEPAIAKNCAIVLRNMATRSSVEAASGVYATWKTILEHGADKPMAALLGEEAMPAISRTFVPEPSSPGAAPSPSPSPSSLGALLNGSMFARSPSKSSAGGDAPAVAKPEEEGGCAVREDDMSLCSVSTSGPSQSSMEPNAALLVQRNDDAASAPKPSSGIFRNIPRPSSANPKKLFDSFRNHMRGARTSSSATLESDEPGAGDEAGRAEPGGSRQGSQSRAATSLPPRRPSGESARSASGSGAWEADPLEHSQTRTRGDVSGEATRNEGSGSVGERASHGSSDSRGEGAARGEEGSVRLSKASGARAEEDGACGSQWRVSPRAEQQQRPQHHHSTQGSESEQDMAHKAETSSVEAGVGGQVKVLVASRLSQAQMNAEACMPDTNLAVEDDPAEQASDIDTGILPQEGLPMPSEQTSASAEAGGGAVVAKRVSHEGAVGPTTGKGPTARKGGSMEVEDVSNSQQPSDVASVPGHGSNDNSRLIVVNNSVESSPTRTQNSDSVSAPVGAPSSQYNPDHQHAHTPQRAFPSDLSAPQLPARTGSAGVTDPSSQLQSNVRTSRRPSRESAHMHIDNTSRQEATPVQRSEGSVHEIQHSHAEAQSPHKESSSRDLGFPGLISPSPRNNTKHNGTGDVERHQTSVCQSPRRSRDFRSVDEDRLASSASHRGEQRPSDESSVKKDVETSPGASSDSARSPGQGPSVLGEAEAWSSLRGGAQTLHVGSMDNEDNDQNSALAFRSPSGIRGHQEKRSALRGSGIVQGRDDRGIAGPSGQYEAEQGSGSDSGSTRIKTVGVAGEFDDGYSQPSQGQRGERNHNGRLPAVLGALDANGRTSHEAGQSKGMEVRKHSWNDAGGEFVHSTMRSKKAANSSIAMLLGSGTTNAEFMQVSALETETEMEGELLDEDKDLDEDMEDPVWQEWQTSRPGRRVRGLEDADTAAVMEEMTMLYSCDSIHSNAGFEELALSAGRASLGTYPGQRHIVAPSRRSQTDGGKAMENPWEALSRVWVVGGVFMPELPELQVLAKSEVDESTSPQRSKSQRALVCSTFVQQPSDGIPHSLHDNERSSSTGSGESSSISSSSSDDSGVYKRGSQHAPSVQIMTACEFVLRVARREQRKARKMQEDAIPADTHSLSEYRETAHRSLPSISDLGSETGSEVFTLQQNQMKPNPKRNPTHQIRLPSIK